MSTKVRNLVIFFAGVLVGALGLAFIQQLPRTQEAEIPAIAAAPPTEPTLPEIPVVLSYRNNTMGRGYIVQFHNISQKHMVLAVELENATLGQKRSIPLELAPGEMREIGAAQGWTFFSGETVCLTHQGYQDKSMAIP